MHSITTTLILLANTSCLAAGFLLTNPIGKYNVTLTNGPLIDYTHNDSSAPTPTPRALMVSVFEPALCKSTVPVPYMPNKTAEHQGQFLQDLYNIPEDLSPVFLQARLPVCPNHASSCSQLEDTPILLFSPGYSIPRLYYNFLASSIASEGFVVITIDHPEDANIITYPDGHAVYNNDTVQSDAIIKAHAPIRVADTSFVIDQLSNSTAMGKLLPHRGPHAFHTDRIAMLGHSLGGVTAVMAAEKDSRIRGAINWDGSFLAQPSASGVSRPVLLMSHGGADQTWPATWPLLKGPKLWVNVANATHQTFTDAPTLLQAAGQDPAALADLLGTIALTEMVEILVEYTTVWIRGVFKGKERGSALEELEGKFPEVATVLKGNL